MNLHQLHNRAVLVGIIEHEKLSQARDGPKVRTVTAPHVKSELLFEVNFSELVLPFVHVSSLSGFSSDCQLVPGE